MPAPFYGAIKGTTAGTPGTGAFTPNAASTGFEAWSDVPSGWMGMVRYEDGSDWERSYSYWNGTTLSRGTNQRVKSSTGSVLSLTSAATAAMVIDPAEVQSHIGGTRWMYWSPSNTGTSINGVGGSPSLVAIGTLSSGAVASTNLLAQQIRNVATSATTANAQAGYHNATNQALVSTTAGMGGFEMSIRFGFSSSMPTGPRLFVGMTSATMAAQTGEPSARVGSYVTFAKDSTDTNIQFLVNNNSGSGTKIDTGIALAAPTFYEATVWIEPGSNTSYGLLMRLDTGEIWYGSTTTDVPASGALMQINALSGLSATTGTAIAMNFGSVAVRVGS
jgi:hypothetical protein